MTPRSPRCSIRSRLPGRGKTSAAISTSTSGSTGLQRSSCVCIDHGRRAAAWRDCAGCASDSSAQEFGSPGRCRSSAGTSPGSVAAGRNSKNLSRMCSQAQARSRTCGCSRSSAAFTRGCARPGSRTCLSRSTTTEPSRQLHYWLGFTRRRLGAGAEPVVRRAKLLLDELGRARRGVELPLAPIHGDYKLGNAVQLSDGSWANLDLDFVRIRERLYDVAASLYWASESGANVDLRELCDAYDSSAPEPVTPDERRFLPAMITLIPLHWVATAWVHRSRRARGGESDGRGRGVVGTPRGIDVVVRPGRGALRSRWRSPCTRRFRCPRPDTKSDSETVCPSPRTSRGIRRGLALRSRFLRQPGECQAGPVPG